jgi:hypothetical protein
LADSDWQNYDGLLAHRACWEPEQEDQEDEDDDPEAILNVSTS